VKNLTTGTLIAIAAGGLFFTACKKEEKTQSTTDKPAVAPAPSAEKTAKVDCGGVNECKGQGTCKQEGHGCGGENECKGKGVITMTESDCKAKGGTVTAAK
jgi:hypothetical protein